METITKVLESNGQEITIELKSTNGGGIAVYGKDFGRYITDPGIVILD